MADAAAKASSPNLESLVAELTTNPVNWVLIGVLGYLLYSLLRPQRYEPPPPMHAKVIEMREYTPADLAEFDGTEGKAIKFAVNGKVFDVSRGRNFYGPGGPYGNFAGRDASRGMAKQSFELENIRAPDEPIDPLDDLTKEERDNMLEWESHFLHKYDHVGWLVSEHSEHGKGPNSKKTE
ncbi:cytochrome b5 [Gonapodya prolifera JEL478]|uniref:Cytochrome b5 n=1 Tax=Gonapodya prolifera (strain JEL478) TaxID=1344416 RepID=A0A139AY04_GONPJ|nr:cytochrome b5 [Gonapodya prolifera JEL478]|eukprot:KXS21599.1 cytochrome b5 [Gonapodya prolifera JEL478]